MFGHHLFKELPRPGVVRPVAGECLRRLVRGEHRRRRRVAATAPGADEARRGGEQVPIPLRSTPEATGDEESVGSRAVDDLQADESRLPRRPPGVLEEHQAIPENGPESPPVEVDRRPGRVSVPENCQSDSTGGEVHVSTVARSAAGREYRTRVPYSG